MEGAGRDMLAALTGAGLSAAAGLNAYIPFLLVALILSLVSEARVSWRRAAKHTINTGDGAPGGQHH